MVEDGQSRENSFFPSLKAALRAAIPPEHTDEARTVPGQPLCRICKSHESITMCPKCQRPHCAAHNYEGLCPDCDPEHRQRFATKEVEPPRTLIVEPTHSPTTQDEQLADVTAQLVHARQQRSQGKLSLEADAPTCCWTGLGGCSKLVQLCSGCSHYVCAHCIQDGLCHCCAQHKISVAVLVIGCINEDCTQCCSLLTGQDFTTDKVLQVPTTTVRSDETLHEAAERALKQQMRFAPIDKNRVYVVRPDCWIHWRAAPLDQELCVNMLVTTLDNVARSRRGLIRSLSEVRMRKFDALQEQGRLLGETLAGAVQWAVQHVECCRDRVQKGYSIMHVGLPSDACGYYEQCYRRLRLWPFPNAEELQEQAQRTDQTVSAVTQWYQERRDHDINRQPCWPRQVSLVIDGNTQEGVQESDGHGKDHFPASETRRLTSEEWLERQQQWLARFQRRLAQAPSSERGPEEHTIDGQQLLYGNWAGEAHILAQATEEQKTLQELHRQCTSTRRQQGEEARSRSDADLRQAENDWARNRARTRRLREEGREETDGRQHMVRAEHLFSAFGYRSAPDDQLQRRRRMPAAEAAPLNTFSLDAVNRRWNVIGKASGGATNKTTDTTLQESTPELTTVTPLEPSEPLLAPCTTNNSSDDSDAAPLAVASEISDKCTSASEVDVVVTPVATTETVDEGVLADWQEADTGRTADAPASEHTHLPPGSCAGLETLSLPWPLLGCGSSTSNRASITHWPNSLLGADPSVWPTSGSLPWTSFDPQGNETAESSEEELAEDPDPDTNARQEDGEDSERHSRIHCAVIAVFASITQYREAVEQNDAGTNTSAQQESSPHVGSAQLLPPQMDVSPLSLWLAAVERASQEGVQYSTLMPVNKHPSLKCIYDMGAEFPIIKLRCVTLAQWAKKWACGAVTVGIGGLTNYPWCVPVDIHHPQGLWSLRIPAMVAMNNQITRDCDLLIDLITIITLLISFYFKNPTQPVHTFRSLAELLVAVNAFAAYTPKSTQGAFRRRLMSVCSPYGEYTPPVGKP